MPLIRSGKHVSKNGNKCTKQVRSQIPRNLLLASTSLCALWSIWPRNCTERTCSKYSTSKSHCRMYGSSNDRLQRSYGFFEIWMVQTDFISYWFNHAFFFILGHFLSRDSEALHLSQFQIKLCGIYKLHAIGNSCDKNKILASEVSFNRVFLQPEGNFDTPPE